jgi:hypothetical protein
LIGSHFLAVGTKPNTALVQPDFSLAHV